MRKSVIGRSGVYPRPCGEAPCTTRCRDRSLGLSPPVRGSLSGLRHRRGSGRSIPARAGKPALPAKIDTPFAVYPRPCGEACLCHYLSSGRWGLSPPVRGSLYGEIASGDASGSIPARAGKPRLLFGLPTRARVYPRPCGEAVFTTSAPRPTNGLSPPVRGSHMPAAGRPRDQGSIPARAGKPRRPTGSGTSVRVYPRPCGEAPAPISPLSRPQGSIPARAGKPSTFRKPSIRVYPRPCGEAAPSRAARMVT